MRLGEIAYERLAGWTQAISRRYRAMCDPFGLAQPKALKLREMGQTIMPCDRRNG